MINIVILIIILILAILLLVGKKPMWYFNRVREVVHMVINRTKIMIRSIYLEYTYKGEKVYYIEFKISPEHPEYIPESQMDPEIGDLNERFARVVAFSKKEIIDQFKTLDADLTYIEISIEQDAHRANNGGSC